MAKSIESIVNSPAFKAILGTSEHLGPFYQNPKIDKMYRTLRLSAFLSSEIGEILKDVDYSDIWKAYQACKGNELGLGQVVVQSLDVNFLAEMLAYLIENSIIDVKSL